MLAYHLQRWLLRYLIAETPHGPFGLRNSSFFQMKCQKLCDTFRGSGNVGLLGPSNKIVICQALHFLILGSESVRDDCSGR
jgi:hypothetical protein